MPIPTGRKAWLGIGWIDPSYNGRATGVPARARAWPGWPWHNEMRRSETAATKVLVAAFSRGALEVRLSDAA